MLTWFPLIKQSFWTLLVALSVSLYFYNLRVNFLYESRIIKEFFLRTQVFGENRGNYPLISRRLTISPFPPEYQRNQRQTCHLLCAVQIKGKIPFKFSTNLQKSKDMPRVVGMGRWQNIFTTSMFFLLHQHVRSWDKSWKISLKSF